MRLKLNLLYPLLLQALVIGLKLFGIIDWAWENVLICIWVPLLFFGISIGIILLWIIFVALS